MTTMVISILHVFPVEVWHYVVVVMQILFSQYNDHRSKTVNSVRWCLRPLKIEVCTPCRDGTEEFLVHALYRSAIRSMVAQLVSLLGTASGGLNSFNSTITGHQQLFQGLPGSG